jgi:pyruvate/2-oxoglutarate dehydrogenase complex dihydrolipoamide dehydrogenase (E3) component
LIVTDGHGFQTILDDFENYELTMVFRCKFKTVHVRLCAPAHRNAKESSQMKIDAIVIGSGQAGNPLSHKLADHGWNVALIEKAQLGGTCVNTGCTPTKTMVASAQIAHYARSATRWGVHATDVRVDLPEVVARKNKVVESFRSGQQRNVDKRPSLHLYHGVARFTGPHQLAVGNETLESERIFINTGTRPMIPKIEGLEAAGYLTNASIMELDKIPEHLLVLGGGYIGLEFGQMFRRFGGRVTVIHRGSEILMREDGDVSSELRKILEAEGIEFVLNARTTQVARSNGTVQLTLNTPNGKVTVSGSDLLIATGRVPNTEELSLEKAGVQKDSKGYIQVNDRLETNVPGIWALGDVKGGPAFTHISYNDYQIVFANLIEGKSRSIANRYVPYSVFTDPQLGGVGLTEKEARAKGFKLKIGKIPMSHVARAIERDETAGLMKIIVDASNDHVLGASILGIEGGETVQILGVLMMAKLPYTLLKGAVYIHPTLAEGLWGLLEDVKPVA